MGLLKNYLKSFEMEFKFVILTKGKNKKSYRFLNSKSDGSKTSKPIINK
jgi:hypothetical protein